MNVRQWVTALLAVVVVLPAMAAGKKEFRTVRDPHFGEVLFYFHQQKYFSALSHLMTAQHFGQFEFHGDEAELLRGGMLLSYGVHLEAARIFERLINDGTSPAVRDRAWFYLAKIHYQRGYHEDAGRDLARIGGALPHDLEIERRLLQTYLLMRNEQYADVVALLDKVKDTGGWTRYARYNLGVALVRSGQVEQGKVILNQIGSVPATDEEFKALRDKANVALGYAALQSGRPDEAQLSLKRVRLEGLMSNKALLGMGWASSALDDQESALVYWDELRQRPVQDAAVLESLLASPYALGKLGAWRRSLEQYEQAIALYNKEMRQLEESIAAIRAGRLQSFLLQGDALEEMGWHWQLDGLPQSPETRYLSQLLAGHEFQEALKSYRDLRFLSARLEEWSHSVASYQDMLATRRQGFRERLPMVLNTKRTQDLERLTRQRDELAKRLKQIEWDNDAEALATEKEREQLARLERIRKVMSRAPVDEESWERYRVLRGLMRWDIETDYPARAWDHSKAMLEVDQALEETVQRRDSLTRAREQTPAKLDAFESRILALLPRIRAHQSTARELEQAQSAYLAEMAVAELDAQRDRLATYLTQVQFAVAQIYDQSTGEAPKPAEATKPSENQQ